MLKKKNRLTTNSSFTATFHQNRVVSDEFFVIFAGKNKNTPEVSTKIGFIVSKKVDKRAVVRNKIKRRLREVMGKYLKEKDLKYMSLIINAKEPSKNLDFDQILKSVYKLLERMAKKFI